MHEDIVWAYPEPVPESTRIAVNDELHEIRTPMNAIVGFGHLAQQTELTPQQRGFSGGRFLKAEKPAKHGLWRGRRKPLALAATEQCGETRQDEGVGT